MQHCQGPRVPVAEAIKPSCGKWAAGGDDFHSSDFFFIQMTYSTLKREDAQFTKNYIFFK